MYKAIHHTRGSGGQHMYTLFNDKCFISWHFIMKVYHVEFNYSLQSMQQTDTHQGTLEHIILTLASIRGCLTPSTVHTCFSQTVKCFSTDHGLC